MENTRKIIERLIALNRNVKRLLVFLNDTTILISSVIISFFLRTGNWYIVSRPQFIVFVIALILWIPISIYVGVYRNIFRFSGSGTIASVGNASLLYAIPFSCVLIVYSLGGVPRTIGVIQPLILFIMLCASRITVRYLLTDILRIRGFAGELRSVIIYGGGSSGRQLATSLRQEPGFHILGFVDDDAKLRGHFIDGFRVYHTTEIERIIADYNITDIILAMPKNTRSRNKDIFDNLRQFSVKVTTLPPISDLVDSRISVDVLRDINVEDLLGRDPIPPDSMLLTKTVSDKVVLVTGAGGSIGGELCKQIILLRPRKIILVEMAEYALYKIDQDLISIADSNEFFKNVEIVVELANIADQLVVDRLFQRHAPNTVFHAAAYKHVPLVEQNPIGGMRNNIFGTYFCALAAEKYCVENFILISTDKAVRPTNIMGATKRVCELILQSLADGGSATKFVMVRFGNVLGSSGSVVPRFEQQIRAGGPVTLTDKRITRYFMTIPEAAQLVIQAGSLAQSGEVCVLDMGESVQILDLAKAMIKLSGFTVKDNENPLGDIEIIEIGLRPGEKLYEELLIGDNPQATQHSRIFKAQEHFIPRAQIESNLRSLYDLLGAGNADRSIELLKSMVPEFRSYADM